ncbi:predicted protein [Naegleria gruberi]|uniref:Predicted protein n=1 Tax=Naegleria gruberi TaxID=5762 RepID=D2VNJ2_NAEGR|nr:uncharacterized protein NAEGRDRAFT_70520 [Naegleria gruberi]EFC41668.1 predicted protein [Naegleria gruberi]|eukprot:XP_002674412.1 predicted protein [Naegleria gruberi strain NEG-M]
MDILKAKLNPQHAGMLLRDQVLKTDKEWNVLPSDSNNIPYYFFWLMNPDNQAAAQLQHRLLIKQATTPQELSYNSLLETLNDRDDIYHDEQDWFQRELYDLDVQKENLNEYFYYFQKHTTKSMLKVHENVHDRWAQFSRVVREPTANESQLNIFETSKFTPMQSMNNRSHFIVALKILDTEYHAQNPTMPPKYNSVGHVAFSVKDLYIDGKVYKVGLAGSGWCAQKYRTQCPSIKFSAWFMKILMMIHMNIRYCYAHVFAENSKSFGYIAKSGMAATRFRLKYLGFNLSLEDHVNISSFDSQKQLQNKATPQLTDLHKVQSLEEYKTLMDKIYGKSNFLITHLDNIFYHPFFAGCFIDEKAQASFQVWKCKYATDQKTNTQIPAFIIFNTVHLSQCDIPLTSQQGDQLMHSIRESLIPQLVKQDTKLVNLAFATHGGSIYQYLLRNYSHLESISFASLYYTFQDNFKLAGLTKRAQQTSLDPVSKFLMPSQQDSNEEEATGQQEQHMERNLFLDIRDCTGKPMVWSEEIKETEMATIKHVSLSASGIVDRTARLADQLATSKSTPPPPIAVSSPFTSHSLFASKL